MYLISVVLLLLIFPAASIILEAMWRGSFAELIPLIGKWFVFWPIGVRLFVAGVRQIAQPRFTAEDIFQIKDTAVLPIVREIGFGNLAMGSLGLLTLLNPAFRLPAAIVGALYYGLAGLGHAFRGHLNAAGWTALVSDLLISFVLAVVILATAAPLSSEPARWKKERPSIERDQRSRRCLI